MFLALAMVNINIKLRESQKPAKLTPGVFGGGVQKILEGFGVGYKLDGGTPEIRAEGFQCEKSGQSFNLVLGIVLLGGCKSFTDVGNGLGAVVVIALKKDGSDTARDSTIAMNFKRFGKVWVGKARRGSYAGSKGLDSLALGIVKATAEAVFLQQGAEGFNNRGIMVDKAAEKIGGAKKRAEFCEGGGFRHCKNGF